MSNQNNINEVLTRYRRAIRSANCDTTGCLYLRKFKSISKMNEDEKQKWRNDVAEQIYDTETVIEQDRKYFS